MAQSITCGESWSRKYQIYLEDRSLVWGLLLKSNVSNLSRRATTENKRNIRKCLTTNESILIRDPEGIELIYHSLVNSNSGVQKSFFYIWSFNMPLKQFFAFYKHTDVCTILSYIAWLHKFKQTEILLEIEITFQQDGAPPHFDIRVRPFMDERFPKHWVGRMVQCSGPIDHVITCGTPEVESLKSI